MQTLTIRYSFSWFAGAVVLGFLGATVAMLIERGPGIVESLSDLVFLVVIVAVMSLTGLLVWAIPAARLHKERVETVAYPFSILWSDVTRVQVASFFWMNWIKVYGRTSRFSLWIPVPNDQIQAIHSFLEAHTGENVSKVFSDDRLNKALQRTMDSNASHESRMNRTYARSFASLACVVIALVSWSSSALDLWALRELTLPSIDALKPLDSKHTWRFVQPMLAEGANAAFVESRISGLVSDAVLLQESWKAYVESRASRAQWELAAWSIVLLCSGLLFAFRAERASAA